MSKSKEELNKIKEEVETVNEKLRELTEDELAQVSGGGDVVRVNVKFGGVESFTEKPAD